MYSPLAALAGIFFESVAGNGFDWGWFDWCGGRWWLGLGSCWRCGDALVISAETMKAVRIAVHRSMYLPPLLEVSFVSLRVIGYLSILDGKSEEGLFLHTKH